MGLGNIEAISFDLDDTLIQYKRSPGEVLQVCFDQLEMEPIFSVEEYYASYDDFADTCDSMDELRSECFAALATENGYDRQLGEEIAETFSNERDQTNVELLPSVARLLDELAERYQLAIITNGARDAQQQKLEAVSLSEWVDTIVIAGHDTPPKPDPEPFNRIVQSLDVTPETTVHIDDSFETDIAGATAAGLASIWFSENTDTQEYESTVRVESHSELWPLLLGTEPPSEKP